MANRNDYNYFDDSYDSRDYRRRQPQRRQSTYNRNIYSNSKRRNRRRTKNRIIIVLVGILILAALVFLFAMAFKGCFSGSSKPISSVSTETTSATQPETESQTSDAQTSDVSPTDPLSSSYFVTPQIEDDGTNGYLNYGTYIWHNTAFEIFGSSEDKAKTYAEAINGYKKALGDDVTVYDMVIPNHTEMGLPQRIRDAETSATSQAENIGQIYSFLDKTVKPINVYNALAEHNDEYIYFRTDHHWSGLGAYYAYTAFAQTTGQDVLDLSTCTEQQIEGFTGSFSTTNSGLESDTVSYWEFPYEVSMDITSNGTTTTYDGPYYPYSTGGANTYGVFIVGDNELAVLHSSSEKADEDKKIAVVKESYGNAFVPYLTYNYSEVHVIDFRYYNGNLADYCAENGIKEVLFSNGVMSANTQMQIDSMDTLFN